MLYAAQSFFRHGEEQLAVTDDTSRRIMHSRIVDAQCDHSTLEARQFLIKGLSRKRELKARQLSRPASPPAHRAAQCDAAPETAEAFAEDSGKAAILRVGISNDSRSSRATPPPAEVVRN